MSTLSIQLPESLRTAAEALAREDQVSLDQLIATALAEKIAALEAERYLQQRAARDDRRAFDAALAKVADVEPEIPQGRMNAL
ncbi:hypothetical protein [Thiohalocapsa sp. ML1]|uniref:hypothetical protein n=1 Tax=Thiohalocapsa sp. ML1 TaxID=1431688 RepID=UPI0007321AAD|nr:hypothetical protein [Thiohalocapsa sp. ML1]